MAMTLASPSLLSSIALRIRLKRGPKNEAKAIAQLICERERGPWVRPGSFGPFSILLAGREHLLALGEREIVLSDPVEPGEPGNGGLDRVCNPAKLPARQKGTVCRFSLKILAERKQRIMPHTSFFSALQPLAVSVYEFCTDGGPL